MTRKKKYTELKGVVRFLQSKGITCYIPEDPRKPSSTYVPYIFDEGEWDRIILEADNLADSLQHTNTDMPIVFPMLVRVLYVCSPRVSEALSLKMMDIDFSTNCLSIQKAKRNRQRVVPVKESTAGLLHQYCTRRRILSVPEAYVFACNDGKPPSRSWVQRWFGVTLERSEIHQARQHPGEGAPIHLCSVLFSILEMYLKAQSLSCQLTLGMRTSWRLTVTCAFLTNYIQKRMKKSPNIQRECFRR